MNEWAEIIVALASFGAGMGALKLHEIRKAKQFYVEPEKKKDESLRVVEHKKEPKSVTVARQKFSYQKRENAGKSIDETKRKHLQPGNIHTIKEVINKSVHDVKNFEHKFFGTVLTVEGRVLIDSLPKKLHSFEVVDGICYVDGVVVKLHPDEVLKLARSIE